MTRSEFERGVVPPGRYAQGGRSPIVWVFLCAACAGFAPSTPEDYSGALSGRCTGCGTHTRELHRFMAWIESRAGCQCTTDHPRVFGSVRSWRSEYELTPWAGGDPGPDPGDGRTLCSGCNRWKHLAIHSCPNRNFVFGEWAEGGEPT